jgi:uncharacterized membrane protein YbjE (DUF340 family)
LLGGALCARLVGRERFRKSAAYIGDGVLYLLLFLMGINTAQIPNITGQIAQMGLDALLATLLAMAGSIVTAVLLSLAVSRQGSHPERPHQKINWERLKTPLVMIGTVVVGFLFGFFTPLFDWFSSDMITPVLYLLLFVVGMQMVQNGVNLLPLLKSPLMLLLPLSTILGTYLGALAIPLAASVGKAWEKFSSAKPTVTAIHAGLECGIINSLVDGMDSLSMGPSLFDVHSTKERLSISSTERMASFLRHLLVSL